MDTYQNYNFIDFFKLLIIKSSTIVPAESQTIVKNETSNKSSKESTTHEAKKHCTSNSFTSFI